MKMPKPLRKKAKSQAIKMSAEEKRSSLLHGKPGFTGRPFRKQAMKMARKDVGRYS